MVYMPSEFSPNNFAHPTSGAAATVTYAAVPGRSHNILGVAWSLSADPSWITPLRIIDGASGECFRVDLTNGGPGFINFPGPLKSSLGSSLQITIPSAGPSVSGKLNVLGHWVS